MAKKRVSKKLWDFVVDLTERYARRHSLPVPYVRKLTKKEARLYRGLCFINDVIAYDLSGLEPYRVLMLVSHELAHLGHLDHERQWLRLHAEITLDMTAMGELDRIKMVCDVSPC